MMRIVDDTVAADPRARGQLRGGRDRARRVRLQHREPSSSIAALNARANELPSLKRIEDEVARRRNKRRSNCYPAAIRARPSRAKLAIGADGRRSLCRAAAGIETDGSRYPQIALTFNLVAHAPARGHLDRIPHRERAVHARAFPGERSSLVCVVDDDDAERSPALDDAALADEIEQRSHSILGKIAVEPGRGVFRSPLQTARQFARNRIALIGEAAHAIPPIGAQGLNLGLRDAATIGELVVEAAATAAMLARRRACALRPARRTDVKSRALRSIC